MVRVGNILTYSLILPSTRLLAFILKTPVGRLFGIDNTYSQVKYRGHINDLGKMF